MIDYSLNNPSADGLSVGMYHLLQDAFKKADYQGEVVSAEKVVVKVRGIKTEEELAKKINELNNENSSYKEEVTTIQKDIENVMMKCYV